jgi:hypothetical protein
MTQTFIDTLVVCTMTGLVLILSGLSWGDRRIHCYLDSYILCLFHHPRLVLLWRKIYRIHI